MQRLFMLTLLLFLLLSACTPSGNSIRNAAVTVTSHDDGAIISGSRNITVSANLTNAAADAAITAELNGNPVTTTRNGDILTIEVTLADNGNTLTVTAANPDQALPAVATLNLIYQPPLTATVTVTSHDDGAIISGSRNITVSANLTNAAADAAITAELNGNPVTTTRNGDILTIEVTLADNGNTLTVTAANPDQAPVASTALRLDYPFISLTTGQAASIVIGQSSLTTKDEASPEKYFSGPYGRPLVASGILYLPDYAAGRILGYEGVPAANDAAADFVLGQANFTDNLTATSSSVFYGPQTVTTDGERLFIADYADNRILVYSSLPRISGAAADHVIGQVDFDSDDAGCSATRFDSLESVTVVNGKLIAADGGNNRVLIWNTVPTVIDTPADLVLGQGRMDTCTENDDDQDGSGDSKPSRRTMYWPTDVWSDGERLIVADAGNSRVLIWHDFPTVSFTPADLVLGQPDFTGDAWGSGPAGLSTPYMLHSNGNQLFVADRNNHRVLIWNEFPADNGQEADMVLGQSNLYDDSSDAGGTTGSTGLNYVTGVYSQGNQLFVVDRDNERYLIFEGRNP